MGAYAARPVTKCESTDDELFNIRYGASSMQGWRRTQEDAHNTVLNFDDPKTMLFAVYDGHGGSEVAKYCALHFPDFIKNLSEYGKSDGDMKQILTDAFLKFDDSLLLETIQKELRDLANRTASPVPDGMLAKLRGTGSDDDDDEIDEDEELGDCEEDETAALLEEACIPVEQVLHKLTNGERGEQGNCEKSTDEAAVISSTDKKYVDSSGDGLPDTKTDKTESVQVAVESAGGSGSAANTESAGGSGSAEGSAGSENKSGPTISDLQKDDNESSDEDDEYHEEEDDSSEVVDSDDESDEDEAANQALAIKFTESDGYLEQPGHDSGCTACLALLHSGQIFVANAGDSRCVLSRNGKAIDLSVDHKPEDEIERTRISNAGGLVTSDGRVNGNLNLSRAIGDHNYKRNSELPLRDQMITSLPDVMVENITPDDDFIIIACDGIWNSVTSQQCVDYVKEELQTADRLSQICENLFHRVLADDTMDGDGTGCDNMTMIIIDLKSTIKAKAERTNSTGFDPTGFDHTVSELDEEPAAKQQKTE